MNPSLKGELSSPTAKPFNYSIISQHAGVVDLVFSRDKGMLHDLVDEIQNYKKFYKIKVLRSLAHHVKGKKGKKAKQELIANMRARRDG